MTRKLLPIIAAVSAAAVPTASALAAGSGHTTTIPATRASIRIDGGYAYYDSFRPLNKREVIVVVKTHGQLPRRYDGLIRANAKLSGHGGGSIGSVGGKRSKCYTFSIPLKNGSRFYTNDNKAGAKASPGRYLASVSADDKDGNAVSSTKAITLRDRKVGDRAGKPLGC
jgi:hypothetical protein